MKKRFNKRAFISLITFFLSLAVFITGIILLVMPDATLAYWNKWTFLNLEKNDWESFHGVVSIYFSAIIIFHIIENWKPMLSYMKSKTNEKFKNKRELFFASIVSLTIIIGSFTNSPISMVTKAFEPISESWYSKKDEPPFEDAQGLPLKLLIKVQNLDEEKVIKIFNKLEIKYTFDESLEDIADNNDIGSKELYTHIQ